MNLEHSTESTREKTRATHGRAFECEVDGIAIKGTVYRAREGTEEFHATFHVNDDQQFNFDLTKQGRAKYAVPFIRRHICPGVDRLRFTSGTLMGRAVCVVLPVEKAFELGIEQCVRWYKELLATAAD